MMKIIKNIIIVCFFVIICSLAVPQSVMAASCKYDGCSRRESPGPDRDGYCYEHSPKNKAVRCNKSGCTSNAYHGSTYCDLHECNAKTCTNKKMDGISFCYRHQSYQGYYTDIINKGSKKKTTSSSSNKKSSGSKKYTSSNKKHSMPDCDDYDSYEDFMDDWDGCMPDGSDAEDYWENW